jgi:HAE1 family hydrophobic/amphiphilic exporter-1
LEKLIKEKYPEVILTSTSSGSDDEGGMFSLFSSTGSNVINLMMRLMPIDERKQSVFEITDKMRADLTQFPEIITATFSTSSNMMSMSGNSVDIEIYGYDFNTTNALAEKYKETLMNLKGAKDVIISRKKDKPELQISLDREKLALHGLNTAMVSAYIRNRVSGLLVSKYREVGDEYDIRIRMPEEYRNSISDLEDITINTPMGKKIKLKEIGVVNEFWGPPSIQHKRKERIVTVSATPNHVALGTLATNIKDAIKDIPVPQELLVNVGGAYEDQMDSFRDLALLMVLSLILVFIVMASQFESFTMPFVIMFSIPFAFTGVLLALFITGTTLTLVAGLGAVLLIGIVVKNGIVLIDFTNLMRDRGYDLYEAIAVAGRSRLRPVVMTASTTILGMLPLALSTGEGSELWRPMGITVIGGLVFSTIVTMVIVPVMYGIFARKGERDKLTKVRKQYHFLE